MVLCGWANFGQPGGKPLTAKEKKPKVQQAGARWLETCDMVALNEMAWSPDGPVYQTELTWTRSFQNFGVRENKGAWNVLSLNKANQGKITAENVTQSVAKRIPSKPDPPQIATRGGGGQESTTELTNLQSDCAKRMCCLRVTLWNATRDKSTVFVFATLHIRMWTHVCQRRERTTSVQRQQQLRVVLEALRDYSRCTVSQPIPPAPLHGLACRWDLTGGENCVIFRNWLRWMEACGLTWLASSHSHALLAGTFRASCAGT